MSVPQPVFFCEVDSPTSNASSPMLICQFANVQSTFWKKVWNVLTNRRRKSEKENVTFYVRWRVRFGVILFVLLSPISLSLHVKLSRSMAHSNQGLQTILIKSWSTAECIWKLYNIPASSPTHVTVNLFVWTGLSVQLFLFFQTYDCLGCLTNLQCLRLECGRSHDGLGKALQGMHRYTMLNSAQCLVAFILLFLIIFFSFYLISLQHKGHY